MFNHTRTVTAAASLLVALSAPAWTFSPTREPVPDERPHPVGGVLIRDRDGAVILRDVGGGERQLAEDGYLGSWNRDGSRVTFVELAPRLDDVDATLIRVHDLERAESWTAAAGSDDTTAVLSPDGRHVLFVSGRTGLAAFWVVSAEGGEAVQLTNTMQHIGPGFVPVPSFGFLWDEASDRIFYEAHYGEPAIYAVQLSEDRAQIVEQGTLGAGRDLRYVDGMLEYTPLGERSPERLDPRIASLRPAVLDFGGAGPVWTGSFSLAVEAPGGGTLAATSGWIRNPLKSTYAPLYGGFKDGHEGHDYMAPRWTQIYAAADGFVEKSCDGHPDGGGGNYGNYVRLGMNGLQYEYAHMEAGTVFGLPVFVGTGMPIGRVGASGSANGVPHLHFQMREEPSVWNLWPKFKPDPPVDPTPLYAMDLLGSLPGSLFHSSLGWGSCGLLDLPQPDYRFPSQLDIDPPQISEIQIFARTGNQNDRVRIRCRIQDPSGVYDDATVPSSANPLSRGAYVTLWDPGDTTPDTILRLHLVSGDALDGVYQSKPFNAPSAWADPLTFVVSADDRANEGFSFGNIGNTATSEYILIDGLPGSLTASWTEVETVDLEISILSAPQVLINGIGAQVDVRVTNQSSFAYSGGYGWVALNPTRDFNSSWHWPPLNSPESFGIPALSPGASLDLTVDVVPPVLATMPHHLFVMARGTNDPVIHNSSRWTDVQIVSPNPDLVVSSVAAPAVIGLGQSMNIQATIENVGVLSALGTVQVGAWISLDGDPFNGNGDDIPMGGTCVPLSLQPGGSAQVSFQSLTLPGNALLSTQSLVVCVDTTGGPCGGLPPCSSICELDELNNCHSQPIDVDAPDLVVSQVGGPGAFGLGGSYAITMDVTNAGSVPASGPVQLGAWLSLDGDPFNGNGDDIPMGGACVTVNLAPGATQTFSFQSLSVPGNALPGVQQLVACVDTTSGACGGLPPCSNICETNELNNCLAIPVLVAGPDAELVSLSFPGSWIGTGAVPVTVAVRNNGPDPIDIPVDVSIGPNFAARFWFNGVAPGATAAAAVPQVFAPAPSIDCGGEEYWSVAACTQLSLDLDPSNNCKSGIIGVADPAFDLVFKIKNEPSSTAQGATISWKVEVTNVGNVSSPKVGAITGVNCSTGPGNWGCCIKKVQLSVPSLDPGETKTYSINGYKIPCAAYCGTYQYVKVEFDYTGNWPDDNCLNGNLDEEPLWVSCTFPCF